MKAHEEIVEFFAAGPSTGSVARFEASPETKTRVEELIHREKTRGLDSEEKLELDDYMRLEHLMRLVKARASSRLAHV